jgi:hypothetical protein
MYDIQHCFICRPSDFTVCRRMLGSKPGQLRLYGIGCSNALNTQLDLIPQTRLDLIHSSARSHFFHTRLDLIHTRLDLIHRITGIAHVMLSIHIKWRHIQQVRI